MSFDEIVELICKCLSNKIINYSGLKIFASERAKFEDWVKVELVECLSHSFNNVWPEKDRIDIVIDNDIAIELSMLATNYIHQGSYSKKKNISTDRDKVIKDISELSNKSFNMKLVIFITFPCLHNNPSWQKYHYDKIFAKLTDCKHGEFSFKNAIPGVIYIGLI